MIYGREWTGSDAVKHYPFWWSSSKSTERVPTARPVHHPNIRQEDWKADTTTEIHENERGVKGEYSDIEKAIHKDCTNNQLLVGVLRLREHDRQITNTVHEQVSKEIRLDMHWRWSSYQSENKERQARTCCGLKKVRRLLCVGQHCVQRQREEPAEHYQSNTESV